MELLEQYQRWRKNGWRMVIVGIAIIIVAILVMSFTAQPPAPDFSKLGIHLLLDDGRGSWDVSLWDEHVATAGEMLPDGGYVVQLVRSDDLDTDKWQTFMDLTRDNNLTPILRLATTFDDDTWTWTPPPVDSNGRYLDLANAYADFISGLDWYTDTHYVTLLNEPNNGHEWGGRPDPVAYAQFVMDVAPILKSADENVVILNGAFDLYAPDTGDEPFPDSDIYYQSAETFMNAMHDAQPNVFKQFDRWNSHSYPLQFTEPPWRRERGFNNIATGETIETAPHYLYNQGVNGYEWELWKLDQFGVDDLPVMITETGWRHSNPADSNSLDAGENYPSVEQVTAYLDLLLLGNQFQRIPDVPIGGWTGLLIDERVIAVIPFAFNGTPDEWSHTNWLEMSPDGEILGQYPMVDLFTSYIEAAE